MENKPEQKKTVKANHFKRNKGKYLATGVCLFFGGAIGLYLAANRRVFVAPRLANALITLTPKVPEVSEVTKTATEFADEIGSHAKDLINHIGRNGHPGNVIYCNETKQVFKSHREATRELGINSRDLWQYLKGLKGNARGYTFKTLGEAGKTETF